MVIMKQLVKTNAELDNSIFICCNMQDQGELRAFGFGDMLPVVSVLNGIYFSETYKKKKCICVLPR